MNYDLVLVGNKTISITEEMKNKLDALLLDPAKKEDVIRIGNTTIKASSIRGIFESTNISLQPNNERFQKDLLEWDADCRRLSELPVEEKINRELLTRVMPEPFLNRGWTDKKVDSVYEQIKKIITDFFTANPQYPRCPARYWFPVIKPYVKEKVARFYEAVGANDEEIFAWAKRNKIKIVASIQSSL